MNALNKPKARLERANMEFWRQACASEPAWDLVGQAGNAGVYIFLLLAPLKQDLQRLAFKHRLRPQRFFTAAKRLLRLQVLRLMSQPDLYLGALTILVRTQLQDPDFGKPKGTLGSRTEPQGGIEERKVPALLRLLELAKAPFMGLSLTAEDGREWLKLQKTLLAGKPGRHHLQHYVHGAHLRESGKSTHDICLTLWTAYKDLSSSARAAERRKMVAGIKRVIAREGASRRRT
jgi:hypothetical protein